MFWLHLFTRYFPDMKENFGHVVLIFFSRQRGLPGKSFLAVFLPKKTSSTEEDDGKNVI